ncbi:hypothetical protein DFH09DRAFT_1308131 [Mycena vulgaris]|nr:hypothetical protein DFH09DRAFT_1308131 [Mycena vulgaris]
MPHGMDPTDYRAFYPYTPNEVKHRKRTTSAQLKVLEGVFKRDTKPNAALRTELAAQLNMTARGVQVWFQNRRAKEKTKASKGALKPALTKDVDSPSPRSSEDPDPQESHDDLLPDLSNSSSPSPTASDPPRLHVVTDSADSSWQGSPVIETPEDPGFDLPSIHMVASRRGSLPVNAFNHSAYGPPLVDPLDPLARRRSVDASLVRLASNPYANLARAKNNALLATQRLSHGRQHHLSRMPRPGMPHRSTVPMQHTRHASMDARGYRIPPSPSPSPLSPYHAVRASLPDNQLYPVTSRNISAPIPGPLPSPGFSFGVANASPDSNRNSPVDFSGFSFPRDDADTEDDGSASYQMSRFSSIASESSATSAYFSDVGSAGEPPDFRANLRRESCPTGFLNLMSGLDVTGPRRASLAEGLIGNYSTHSDSPERDNHGAVGYPSPSSTVSPGSSPHISGNSTAMSMSNSSELNYALHNKHGDVPYPPRSAGAALDMGNADTPDSSTFFFDSTGNHYPHSAPATSDEFADKFNYDYGMQYTPPHAEGYPEGAYNGDAQGPTATGMGQYQNMEFSPSESYYESHAVSDTPFTYP